MLAGDDSEISRHSVFEQASQRVTEYMPDENYNIVFFKDAGLYLML
jgi:hypothetical protein